MDDILGFTLRRFFQAIFTIAGVLFVVFVIIQLTGDPVSMMFPIDAPVEQIEAARVRLGLDQPIPIQFYHFSLRALRGNFGNSLRFREMNAFRLTLERYPATLELALASLFWSFCIAVVLGTVSAVKHNTFWDQIISVISVLGQSIPNFWLGIMLILIFSVNLRLLPTSGRGDIYNVILPSFTLGTFFLARMTRLIRSSLLEVMYQDYIATARAKGLNEGMVLFKHIYKNAGIPIITILGLDLATLLGGAVVTEVVFAWPGIGRLIVESVYLRDFPVVQAAVFLIALTFILINFFVDIAYLWLDPRIKYK